MTEDDLIAQTARRAMRNGKPYRKRSAETWNLIRTAYLRGETAAALARRYDVSHGNIMRRAREEGWTRKAFAESADRALLDLSPPPEAGPSPQTGAPPAGDPGAAPDPWVGLPLGFGGEPDSPIEVHRMALAAVARCLLSGRYAEAERMGKLAEGLARLGPPERLVYVRDDGRTEAAAQAHDAAQFHELTERIERRFVALEPIFQAAGIEAAVIALIDDYLVRERHRGPRCP